MESGDSATAMAVARYFLELYPYVYATGDLAEWKALSHPECVFCASVVTNAEALYAAGQRAQGGMVRITESSVKEISDRWYSVQLTMTQDPSTTIGSDGAVVEDFPEEKTYATGIAVLWEGGAWTVREVEPKVVDGAQ